MCKLCSHWSPVKGLVVSLLFNVICTWSPGLMYSVGPITCPLYVGTCTVGGVPVHEKGQEAHTASSGTVSLPFSDIRVFGSLSCTNGADGVAAVVLPLVLP